MGFKPLDIDWIGIKILHLQRKPNSKVYPTLSIQANSAAWSMHIYPQNTERTEGVLIVSDFLLPEHISLEHPNSVSVDRKVANAAKAETTEHKKL